MAHDDAPLGEPFRAREDDVVAVERADHRGADGSGDDGDERRRQRHRGQDQVHEGALGCRPLPLDERVEERHAGDPLAGVDVGRDVAGEREPAEVRGEEQLEHQAEPEDRDPRRNHHGEPGGAVRHAAAVNRGENAEWNGHEDVDQHRREHELDRGRQDVAEVGGNRPVRERGRSEVTVEQPREVIAILREQRFVEAEALARCGDRLR